MAVYSSINLSQVEYGRVDADFYHPIYLNELDHWEKLKVNVGVSKLSQLISAPVRTGRTPLSRTVKSDDKLISFIKTDTLREGYIDFTKSANLPARVLTLPDFILPHSVIVTIIGATPEIVGRAAIVRETDPQCVTNQNVAIISTNEKCDPYFLTAYLQTKYGRDQLWRHSRRTEQVNLNCREVERILVPNPPIEYQKEIGNFVRDSFNSSDKCEAFYTQAQQLLESELGLNKLSFQKPLGYTTKFSELEISRRADAEFFKPDYQAISTLIKRKDHATLGRLFSIKRGVCIDPKKYVDNYGVSYIRIKELSLNHPLLPENSVKIPSDKLPLNYQKAEVGNYILAVIGATIGKINLIDKSMEGSLYSNNTACLSAKTELIYPNAFELILRSKIVQSQIQQRMAKTAQEKISDPELRRVLIPQLDSSLMNEIEDLCCKSKENFFLSKKLLEQAKTHVEQLIETAVQS